MQILYDWIKRLDEMLTTKKIPFYFNCKVIKTQRGLQVK